MLHAQDFFPKRNGSIKKSFGQRTHFVLCGTTMVLYKRVGFKHLGYIFLEIHKPMVVPLHKMLVLALRLPSRIAWYCHNGLC